MKHLLFSALVLLAFQTVNAQYRPDFNSKNIFISLGGEIGAPSNTPYNLSYGTYFEAEAKFNKIGITAAAEYTAYNYKSSLFAGSNNNQHPSFTPLKAGLKYYTSPAFYICGEAGATLPNDNIGISSMFVYSLGFGFDIPVNKFSDVAVGFAYQNYSLSQYQTTGLKLAYRLGW